MCLKLADLHNRDHILMKTVLVINLEVKDNHEEAAIGARLTLDLCQEVCILKVPQYHQSYVQMLKTIFLLNSWIDWCGWIMGGLYRRYSGWFWETASTEVVVQHLLLLKISDMSTLQELWDSPNPTSLSMLVCNVLWPTIIFFLFMTLHANFTLEITHHASFGWIKWISWWLLAKVSDWFEKTGVWESRIRW